MQLFNLTDFAFSRGKHDRRRQPRSELAAKQNVGTRTGGEAFQGSEAELQGAKPTLTEGKRASQHSQILDSKPINSASLVSQPLRNLSSPSEKVQRGRFLRLRHIHTAAAT